ncbi:MAG: hypothetical protein VR77_02170 [Flavobacteriales bacterium BRH_c54]|nr:MAG: hypothetical protein VR77_02170 [Flavobacteriales bacterium BRH_c54]
MSINKLTLKKLVEFRRLSERRKNTFTNNLKKTKEPNIGEARDYWNRSLSGISTAFKNNDNSIIKERLDGLLDDYTSTSVNKTKIMYKRNIDILEKYIDFDFSNWWSIPIKQLLSKPDHMSIIDMNGIPLQIKPHHIFTYENNGSECVGGIWFITWLEGFKKGDMGIYSEALFRYLSKHYSKDYTIDPSGCITIDVSNMQVVGYEEILNGKIPSLIDTAINDIKKYLN